MNRKIKIKLADDFSYIPDLLPLFEAATKASDGGKPGAIIAQICEYEYEPGIYIEADFIDNDKTSLIRKVVNVGLDSEKSLSGESKLLELQGPKLLHLKSRCDNCTDDAPCSDCLDECEVFRVFGGAADEEDMYCMKSIGKYKNLRGRKLKYQRSIDL